MNQPQIAEPGKDDEPLPVALDESIACRSNFVDPCLAAFFRL